MLVLRKWCVFIVAASSSRTVCRLLRLLTYVTYVLTYVTLLTYLLTWLLTYATWLLTYSGAVVRGQCTDCCSERQAKNTESHACDSDFTLSDFAGWQWQWQKLTHTHTHTHTHTLIGNQTQMNNYNSSITKPQLTTQNKNSLHVMYVCT